MNYDKIIRFVQDSNSVIKFKSASYFGCVFERQIGSVSRIFEGIFSEVGHLLNLESLSTFRHEVAAVVNLGCSPASTSLMNFWNPSYRIMFSLVNLA